MQKRKTAIRVIAMFLAIIMFSTMPMANVSAQEEDTIPQISFFQLFFQYAIPIIEQIQKVYALLGLGEDGKLPKIGISAGHGGDTGASVVISGKRVYEDGKNLAVALAVNKEFESLGYPTLMNRKDSGPCPKEEKLALFKAWNPTVMMEFHYNIGGGKGSGLEVWYEKGNAEGKRFAEILAKKLSASVGLTNRGAKSDDLSPGGSFYICRSFPVSVLVECAFLDNSSDVKKLDSSSAREKFAKAAVEAVEEYLTGS